MCQLNLSDVPKPAAHRSDYKMNTHLPELAKKANILCNSLTLQIIPEKVPIIFRLGFLVSTLFLCFNKSQVGAFPYLGVRVRLCLHSSPI